MNTKHSDVLMPIHVGITVEGTTEWARENGIDIKEAYRTRFEVVRKAITLQTGLKIPVVTFFLLPAHMKKSENYSLLLDSIAEFLQELDTSLIAHEYKIKVSVLGKWYDLPSRIVDPIKKIVADTKDYDRFFVNFCINYDGQEEIVDACRIIAMKIKSGKIDVDSINKETLKEDVYSSFLIPLDLLIKTGAKKTTDGFLLWDSTNAVIYFSNVMWPDFDEADLLKALQYYGENR